MNRINSLPKIETPIPGPNSKLYLSRLLDMEAPSLTLNDSSLSIIWEETSGMNVFDVDGNKYLDYASGLNVANVGHTNQEVVDAAKEQLNVMLQGMGDFHANKRKIEFLEKVLEIVPIKNSKAIVSVNGSDAVDAALKTATLYTGKRGFLSFYGAYHGMGAKSLEVTARHHFRAPFSKDIPRSTTFLPYPYCYRCPFSKNNNDCVMDCLKNVEQTIENTASGSDDIGAIIIESFQGRGGVVQAPPAFLKGLREICDRNGILLIVDEILSGFGRTGKWFGFEHAGVEPDIVTIGKGLSSGYPISACVGKASVMDVWKKFEGESVHTSTFQGNPVGSVLATSSINYIQKNSLIEQSNEKGQYFKNRLIELIGNHQNVGEIRGKGLMIGIEFVKNKKTKEPDAELCWEVMRRSLQKGMILLNGGHQVNVLCLTPPLIIKYEEIDFCIDTLKSVLEDLTNHKANNFEKGHIN